jgi:hypothetical protein
MSSNATTPPSELTARVVASEDHPEANPYTPNDLLRAMTGRVRFRVEVAPFADGNPDADNCFIALPASTVLIARRLLKDCQFPLELLKVPRSQCTCDAHVGGSR